jgi:hypothetical protein
LRATGGIISVIEGFLFDHGISLVPRQNLGTRYTLCPKTRGIAKNPSGGMVKPPDIKSTVGAVRHRALNTVDKQKILHEWQEITPESLVIEKELPQPQLERA